MAVADRPEPDFSTAKWVASERSFVAYCKLKPKLMIPTGTRGVNDFDWTHPSRFLPMFLFPGESLSPRMPTHLIARSIAGLFLGASVYGTAHLGQDYYRALFGRPDAQWQFAFMLAPIPILFGAIGLAIAIFLRPRLSRAFILGAWVINLVPLGLLGLVWIHAY